MNDVKKENLSLPFPEKESMIISNKKDIISIFGAKITKAKINNVAHDLATKILDEGKENVLHTYINASIIKKTLDELMTKIKDGALDEVEKYGFDNTYCGVEFDKMNTGKRYSYDHDSAWIELDKKEKEIKKLKKEYEEKMKAASKFKASFDDEGIEILPAKIKSEGSETIKITIK